MPYFSFDKGENSTAIARVKGGKHDGEILFIHDDTINGGGKKNLPKKRVFNRARYVKSFEGMKPSEKTRTFIRLEEAYDKGLTANQLDEVNPVVKEVYERMLQDASNDKSVELDDEGCFELLPSSSPSKRDVFYIAGQSGSGKSYVAKQIASYYHKLFPDRGVYLISKLEEDETLDALKFLKRINIQSLIDDYPDLNEFNNCCLIADDYDTLTGQAEKTVSKLIDDIAIMGRHENITILCLSHYLTNYKKTRLLLNEATHIVVYPLSTSYHALHYLLKNYVGCEEEDLKRHKKLGSRWLCYKKGFPQYMVSQKNAEILHC